MTGAHQGDEGILTPQFELFIQFVGYLVLGDAHEEVIHGCFQHVLYRLIDDVINGLTAVG